MTRTLRAGLALALLTGAACGKVGPPLRPTRAQPPHVAATAAAADACEEEEEKRP